VSQVPALSSSGGFKAADWPKTPIWTGRLRVVSRGDKVQILLEHTDKEGLFAACPVQNEKTVEQTVDSSRYFVLRVSDGKKNAVIGIGFNDRTQAFDFKVAVQDQINGTKVEKELPSGPALDLSIPKDGKIHVNLGKKTGKKDKDKNDAASAISAGLGGLKLAPPPSSSSSSASSSSISPTASASKEKNKKKEESANDPFAAGNTNGTTGTKHSNSNAGSSDWVTF